MIQVLQRISSPIIRMQEIPTTFFSNIEASANFGDHLFPGWFNNVFGQVLKDKFEQVYNRYKLIVSPFERQKVIEAFQHGNRIQELCENSPSVSCLNLLSLPLAIRQPAKDVFIHLYNALDNVRYETEVTETLSDVLESFTINNDTEICPFCGIEGFINVEGEPRQTLDHWLYKENYPFSAANFDNLMPIGDKCNRRPAKGTKDVLFNNAGTARVVAFYPYKTHHGISIQFRFINEPISTNVLETDWELVVRPTEAYEQDIFDSWDSTFNIITRYNAFIKKRIIPKWEQDYKRFIEQDHQVNHANDLNQFKENLKLWKATFKIKSDPRAILYRAFADYLIENGSDSYLNGLYQNFLRST